MKINKLQIKRENRQVFASKNKTIWDLHPTPEGVGFTAQLDKASAYLFHICQNHPFIDGNKRTALVSMLVFLDLNGKSIDYQEAALEDLTLSVARGKLNKDKISSFLIKENEAFC